MYVGINKVETKTNQTHLPYRKSRVSQQWCYHILSGMFLRRTTLSGALQGV